MTTTGTTPPWDDRRLSFGSVAELYDRWRPGYPAEAVRWLVGPQQPPCRVVDLGAGTGRLAVAVADLGHDVVAVEPDEDMRTVAEHRLPGRTLAGSAEMIPLPDASVDVVVAGQAYHWFDPSRALPEIARVLRPGGALALAWNLRDGRVAWVSALFHIVGGEDHLSALEEPPPDLGDRFGLVASAQFRHEQELDADGLVALAGSWSYVALRPDRDEVLEAVRELAVSHPQLVGRERFGLPYVTIAFRARTAEA